MSYLIKACAIISCGTTSDWLKPIQTTIRSTADDTVLRRQCPIRWKLTDSKLDFVLKNEDQDMEFGHMASFRPNEKFCPTMVNCDVHQLKRYVAL